MAPLSSVLLAFSILALSCSSAFWQRAWDVSLPESEAKSTTSNFVPAMFNEA
jgi:hypothetical protein